MSSQKIVWRKLSLFFLVVILCAIPSITAQGADLKVWEESQNVEVDKKWRITFNKTVHPDFIHSNYIYVTSAGGSGDKLSTSISVENDGKTIVLHPPKEDYIPGNAYLLHINEMIKSFDGEVLDVFNTKKFTIKPIVEDQGQFKETFYEENYEITNDSDVMKEIVLPESAAFAKYDKNGGKLDFGLSTKNILLNSGDSVVVSYEENKSRQIHVPQGVKYKTSQNPALLNVTHDATITTTWMNQSAGSLRGSDIKVVGKEYSYYTLNEEGNSSSVNYVDQKNHFLSVPNDGQLIVSAENNELIQIYAPYQTYSYTKRDGPAVEKYELQSNESLLVQNLSQGDRLSDFNYFTVYNKSDRESVLDLAYYGDLKEQSSWKIIADKNYRNNELEHGKILPQEEVHLTNLENNSIYVVVPYGKLHLQEMKFPAVIKRTVKPGETAIIHSHFDFTQSVEIGNGVSSKVYDYAAYSDYKKRLSREMRSEATSKEFSTPAGGTLVITPKTGKPEVIASSFINTNIEITKEKEALEYYSIPQGKSIFIKNDQEYGQRFFVAKGERVHKISHSPITGPWIYLDQSLRWAGMTSLDSKYAIEYTNLNQEALELVFPEGSFHIVSGNQTALQTTKIDATETVVVTNHTDVRQSFLLEADELTYDYILYDDLSNEKVNDLGINQLLEKNRPERVSLVPKASYVFMNTTGKSANLIHTDGHLEIKRNANSHMKKQTIFPNESLTYVNQGNKAELLLLTGTAPLRINYYKFNELLWSNNEALNGRMVKHIQPTDKMEIENNGKTAITATTLK